MVFTDVSTGRSMKQAMRDDVPGESLAPSCRPSAATGSARLHVLILISGVIVWVHAVYLSYSLHARQVAHLSSSRERTEHTTLPHEGSVQGGTPYDEGGVRANAAIDLFIYRRSFKTGSSSMSVALYHALTREGFTAVIRDDKEARIIARSEFVRPNARKLALLYHNAMHRGYHSGTRAVVADTVRDGFDQVTSFCRTKRRVATCDDAMVHCMNSSRSNLLTYRFAGRLLEDDDTYIDLPLSSAHRALSAAVLRTVFPNATLHVDVYNRKNTSCEESEELRAAYDSMYSELEKQNKKLLERMLVIAGYPLRKESRIDGKYSVRQLVDAAEAIERRKLDLREQVVEDGFPKVIFRSLNDWEWTEAQDGSLVVQQTDFTDIGGGRRRRRR